MNLFYLFRSRDLKTFSLKNYNQNIIRDLQFVQPLCYYRYRNEQQSGQKCEESASDG